VGSVHTAAERYAEVRRSVGAGDRAAIAALIQSLDVNALAGIKLTIGGVDCTIMASREGGRLHLSVSDRSRAKIRLPSWEAMLAVRACAFADEDEVSIILPGGDETYVNVTEALHLWGPKPEVPRE